MNVGLLYNEGKKMIIPYESPVKPHITGGFIVVIVVFIYGMSLFAEPSYSIDSTLEVMDGYYAHIKMGLVLMFFSILGFIALILYYRSVKERIEGRHLHYAGQTQCFFCDEFKKDVGSSFQSHKFNPS